MDQEAQIPQLDEVLIKLREFLHGRGEVYGLKALGCFGSVARSEATTHSDVDVVYQAQPTAKLTLFDLVEMQEELVNLLGCPVDLTDTSGNSPSSHAGLLRQAGRG